VVRVCAERSRGCPTCRVAVAVSASIGTLANLQAAADLMRPRRAARERLRRVHAHKALSGVPGTRPRTPHGHSPGA
jgi:hypothetical protein